jgi:hypothetical protein
MDLREIGRGICSTNQIVNALKQLNRTQRTKEPEKKNDSACLSLVLWSSVFYSFLCIVHYRAKSARNFAITSSTAVNCLALMGMPKSPSNAPCSALRAPTIQADNPS